jgi:type IV pilus assembly protein PilC
MPQFSYIATGKNGSQSEGTIAATDPQDARWKLFKLGLKPDQIVPLRSSNESTSGGRGIAIPFLGKLKGVHVELVIRQTATMLRSGMTLLGAIETIIEQPPSRAVRRLFEQIRSDIEAGMSLSEALQPHPVFSGGTVSMIRLGEESGNLEIVLERSADTMQARRQNRNAIMTAMFYPMFTLFFAFGVTVYMVIAVIPPMKKAMDTLGRKLPAITQSLLDVSAFAQTQGPKILGIMGLAIVVLVVLYAWPLGRLYLDKIQLRIPLFGAIVKTGGSSLFSRSLSTLLASGIPLVEGLRIISSIHGNKYLAAVVESARNRILEGSDLASSLARGGAYTPMMVRMVAVGETSGNLEEILTNIADFHDDRLKTMINQLSAMLEPAIVVLVGGLVGYVYLAFFLGLYGTMS